MDAPNKAPMKVTFSNVTTSPVAEREEPACKEDGGTHGAAPKVGNQGRIVAGAAGHAVDNVLAVCQTSQPDSGANRERTHSELDLFAAAREGASEDVLRILSTDRTKINEPEPCSKATPLIIATESNHSLTVLLLLRLGAKVGVVDKNKQTALSHAIVRKNGTIVLALLSALCGLSGSTEHQVSAALTRRESSLLYLLLAELTSVQIGRATALLALVNPEVVMITLIRGSTAARDKALLVEHRSPVRAEQLRAASRRFDAAISSLLLNIAQVIVPNYTAKSQKSGSLTALSTRNFSENSINSRRGQHSRRELVRCLLDGSHAVEVAVRYEHKPFFALPGVMNYMEDQWGGSLAMNMRNAEEQEQKPGEGQAIDGDNDGEIFLIGCRVKHEKHGEGSVISRHRSGRLHVEFDGGDTHNYVPASAKAKLTLITLENEMVRDEDEDEGVAAIDIIFALPGFILQGLVLWLPLAMYPPLARALRDDHGAIKKSLCGPKLGALMLDHYTLEVPVLKFYLSVTLDVFLFLSLTFLSHPRYYTLVGWTPWEEGQQLSILVPIHCIWAIGVTVNEWLQFMQYKSQVLAEYTSDLRKTRWWSWEGLIKLLGRTLNFFPEFLHIDDMVDLFDLFGPLLASISLLNTWTEVQKDTYDRADAYGDTMAVALVLLGFRLLRPVTMMPTLGPLVLMVNKMVGDVTQWALVQVVFLLGFASGIYALAGDPETALREGNVTADDECELLTIGLNQLGAGEGIASTSSRGAADTWLAGFRQLLESMLKQDSELACLRQNSSSWFTAPMIMFFQLFSAILMINMLIAMMAKTFDLIHSENATNFNFLRARVVSTWVSQHPSPPPYNLFALLYHIVAGVVRIVLWVVRRCQGVNTVSTQGALLDSEAQRLVLSGRRSSSPMRSLSLSPRKKKPPPAMPNEGEELELEPTPSLTSKISRLLRGDSKEDAPTEAAAAGAAPTSPGTKRRAFLHHHDKPSSIFAGLGEKASERGDRGGESTCNFVLKSDFRDEPHLRRLAKLIGAEIAGMVDERRADQEMLTRMESLEKMLELTHLKTHEIYNYLHECAQAPESAPWLQRVDSQVGSDSGAEEPYDTKKGPLVLAPQGDAPPAPEAIAATPPSPTITTSPPSPSMRPREEPPLEDPPSEPSEEAPLSGIVPSPYERGAYVHRDLKASLSRMDLTQTNGGQEQALWQEPAAPSPVVRKIGAIPAQERKRVRRSRQARAHGGAGALRPTSLVTSLADGVRDGVNDLAEDVSELASNVARPIQDNVVRPIGVGVQALASIGQESRLTDGLVAPQKKPE